MSKPWGIRVVSATGTDTYEGKVAWVGHGMPSLSIGNSTAVTMSGEEDVVCVYAPGAWLKYEVLLEDPDAVALRRDAEIARRHKLEMQFMDWFRQDGQAWVKKNGPFDSERDALLAAHKWFMEYWRD